MQDRQASDEHRLRRAARKIAEQHRDLSRLEAQLRQVIAAGDPEPVERALVRFEAALGAHFDLEEGAYYPVHEQLDAAEAARLRELTDDHGRLRAEAAQLFDILKADGLRAFSRAVSTFSHDLAQHEAREEQLMEGIHASG